MKKSSKIVYLTGTRAEYGLMKETLKELHKRFDLRIIVTGTHLSKKFGYTIDEIKKDNMKIAATIKIPLTPNNLRSMADNVGVLIPRITTVLHKIRPNLVLVEGDRGEQLAMTIAAAYMNIPVAHTSGGAVSKSIDDSTRNAITKFAHLHLSPTKKSAQRIIKMNEEKWRVHVVGPPINLMFRKTDVRNQFCINKNEVLLIVLQHPVTTQYHESRKQMKETLEAIKKLKYKTIVIYPNSDAGSMEMIDEIEKYKTLSFVKIFKNLENDIFMNLLATADVIIGNSSAGIVEAPFFKLPVVNIGIRQHGREHGDNVIMAKHRKNEIMKAIKKALEKEFYQKISENPYYIKGKPEKNIANVLSKIVINSKLLSKQPVY